MNKSQIVWGVICLVVAAASRGPEPYPAPREFYVPNR